jgi:hypothetical protein
VELSSDEWGYELKAPEGMAIVKASTYREHELQFDPAKHAKLDCHAVGVNPGTLALVEVCTDPGSHPDPREKERAERDRRDAEREEENLRRTEEAERRHAFVTRTAKGKVDKEVLLHLCFLSYVEEPGYGSRTVTEIGWNLLGIEEEQEVDALVKESGQAPDVSIEEVDYDELLLAFGRRSIANRYRATFVLAAAMFECAPYSVPSSYLELLVSLGYEPSASEKLQLEAKPGEAS